MVDYANLATVAKRLIDENGRDVTLRKIDRGHANPAEPWRAPDITNIDVGPIKGVLVPFNANDIDETLVRAEDKKALISANDGGVNLIEEFDVLLDGSEEWKIVNVKVINPGDTRVIYILQVRL